MTAPGPAADEVEYHAPEAVEAARAYLADADGRAAVVAGGQTLSLLLREGFVDADVLVDVAELPALRGISFDGDVATIGSATTYADLAAHRLGERVAMVREACSAIADRQVRNLGTIGGALAYADPALDILTPLLCLEAELGIGRNDGHRTVPLSSFLVGHLRTDLGSEELLESIRFEVPDGDRVGTAYEKHSTVDGGWATVGVASLVGVDDGVFSDVRVGLGAVAATAIRSPAIEAMLRDQPVTRDAIATASRAVSDDIDPVDDLSGSAEYKRRLAPTLVERCVERAVHRCGGFP